MTAYYNEFDPHAAQWLRNLIAAGHIAPGVVDERDIRDVRPDEIRRYTQAHFFAGIGVWSFALRRAGWPDERPVWTGSCPCQPFSAAGEGNGFADERHLWPALHHLIIECGPDVFFGEQVASKDGLAWLDLVQADMEGTGYAGGALDICAAGFGTPHIRQRLWLAFELLADATSERRNGRELAGASGAPPHGSAEAAERRTTRLCEPSGCRATGGMAQHHSLGSATAAESGFHDVAHHIEPCGGLGGLVDTAGAGRQGQPDRRRDTEPQHAAAERAGGHVGALADHDPTGFGGERGARIQRQPIHDADGCGTDVGLAGIGHNGGPTLVDQRPGPTNGVWGAVDWLRCRDGKWRPVEPGTFPLAHGTAGLLGPLRAPEDAPGRVGMLKGYGNAIVAEAAAEFVRAYLDVRSHA